jgi:hypothetical protein
VQRARTVGLGPATVAYLTAGTIVLRLALAAAFALCLGLAAPPATAQVWTARDLGTIATEQACVETAVRVFETYANLFGASDLKRGAWLVALDGLERRAMHGLITCTLDARNARATLVIWSADEGMARLLAADRLAGMWARQTAKR